MKQNLVISFIAAALAVLNAFVLGQTTQPLEKPGDIRVPLVFAGGHDTDPRDGGRPVMLVASALAVPPQVFRDAFKGVHPARGGGGPSGDEARANKKVLLDALSQYGVTNDRLDEVSNRYRYRPQAGELWPTQAAEGYVVMRDGKPTGIVITQCGYGYSSLPNITAKDHPELKITATLAYGKAFETNGSVASAALTH